MPARKIRGHWCAELRVDGRRRRVRAKPNTKQAAEALWHELRARPDAPRVAVALPSLAARWLAEYVAIHNRKVTYRTRECHLRVNILPFFGRQTVRSLRTTDVDRFTAHLVRQGLHPKRINDILCTLRSCLIKGRDWEMLERLPRFTMLACPPPSKEFLSIEQARRLVAAAPPGQWRTMILVALTTGLRIGELIALRWDHVDLELELLTVALTDTWGDVTPPKSGEQREVPLVAEVSCALRELPRPAERVFPVPAHITSAYNYVWRVLDQVSQGAAVSARWHLLRHTFASHLVMASGSLETAQDCLGHSTPTMTRRYAHLADHYVRSRVRMLPNFGQTGTSGAREAIPPVSTDESPDRYSAKETQNRIHLDAA